MKKNEFVAKLSQGIDQSKKSTEVILDEFCAIIRKALKSGDEVVLPIGKFELRKRSARMAVNPQTRERIKVKAKVVPVFRPSKAFKDGVGR